MATNPMQRKARNSFLLGMLVMLLISGAIIALLFMQLMNKNKKERFKSFLSIFIQFLNFLSSNNLAYKKSYNTLLKKIQLQLMLSNKYIYQSEEQS